MRSASKYQLSSRCYLSMEIQKAWSKRICIWSKTPNCRGSGFHWRRYWASIRIQIRSKTSIFCLSLQSFTSCSESTKTRRALYLKQSNIVLRQPSCKTCSSGKGLYITTTCIQPAKEASVEISHCSTSKSTSQASSSHVKTLFEALHW